MAPLVFATHEVATGIPHSATQVRVENEFLDGTCQACVVLLRNDQAGRVRYNHFRQAARFGNHDGQAAAGRLDDGHAETLTVEPAGCNEDIESVEPQRDIGVWHRSDKGNVFLDPKLVGKTLQADLFGPSPTI